MLSATQPRHREFLGITAPGVPAVGGARALTAPHVGGARTPVPAGFPAVGVSSGESSLEDDLDHPVLREVAARIAAMEPDYPTPVASRAGEAVVEFDSQNRYLLPALDNKGGSKQAFPRVSHVAKTLDDSHLLHRWQMHRLLEGLVRHSALLAAVDPVAAASRDHRVKAHLDAVVELAHAGAGTERASKFGSAVHAWIESVDLGLHTLDEVDIVCRAHVAAFLEARDAAGLDPVPEYVERVVHNSVTGAAGRLDQLVRNRSTRELEVLDVKTSRSTDFSALGFLVQLGQYSTAEHMLALDGSKWGPMPRVSATRAWVAHVPSVGDKSEPDKAVCQIVPVDLTSQIPAMAATAAMRNPVPAVGLAAILRAVQSNTKRIIGKPAGTARVRFPSTHEMIVDRLDKASTPAEMDKVFMDFSHAWNDDYTRLGIERLRVLTSGQPR